MDRTSGPRLRAARRTVRLLMGCDERTASRPAGEVLARIPWDGPKLDPARVTAEQFLGAIIG